MRILYAVRQGQVTDSFSGGGYLNTTLHMIQTQKSSVQKLRLTFYMRIQCWKTFRGDLVTW